MTSATPKAGDGLLRDTRRSVPAAIAILAGVVTFLLAETIAAAAWTNPAYSYADDFVSDLGVTGPPVLFKGHLIHSPLAWLLNTGFLVDGTLVAIAAVLLLRPRGQGRMARWQLRMLFVFGIGLSTAAILHEAPAWSLPYHAVGATLAMAGGNIAALLTGRLGGRLGLPTWLARAFTALGAVGLASFLVVQVLVMVSPDLPHGIGAIERLAAYPLIVAQFAAGIGLLAENARLRRRRRELVLAR